MKKLVKSIFHSIENRYYKFAIKCGEMKKIRNKSSLWRTVVLTDKQEKLIIEKWGRTEWHRYYQYFTGKFNENYIPEIEYSTIIEPNLNDRHIALEMEDKGRLPIIYGNIKGLRIPKTVVVNASGIFYDAEGELLSKEEAKIIVKNYLQNVEGAIVKPTRGSCSGRDVKLIKKDNFLDFELERNFIVQELIENQSDIKKLNRYSLNTFRVMTYICDNKYYCAPLLLRMGGGLVI